MSGFNMPPGVSPGDIPGNEPDDSGAAQMLIASLERDRADLLAALRGVVAWFDVQQLHHVIRGEAREPIRIARATIARMDE